MIPSIRLSRLALIGLCLFAIFSVILTQQNIFALTPQKTHTLAFISLKRGEDRFNLYTIHSNGSSRRQLSQKLSVTPTFVWSNNGQKLAFMSDDTDVYIVNANGSGLTQLLDESYCKAPSSSIAWAANNRKLVFTRNCDGSSLDTPGSAALYVSDTTGIKGTKVIKTWQSSAISEQSEISSYLYLSPNGEQVVFFQGRNIYKMNTDGSGLTKLGDTLSDYPLQQIVWSPDGKEIIFSTGEYLKEQIYLVNIDNKTIKNLTNESKKQPYQSVFSLSPDGNQVAYFYSQNTNNPGKKLDIYLLNIRNGNISKLTQKSGEYSSLVWSPDGKQIAFAQGEFSQERIYLINVDSLKSIPIPPQLQASTNNGLSWSTDSQKIAFINEVKLKENGDSQDVLYIVNRDGSKLTKLSRNQDTSILEPKWKP